MKVYRVELHIPGDNPNAITRRLRAALSYLAKVFAIRAEVVEQGPESHFGSSDNENRT
ncbi:MAG: hypothetical protein ABL888_21400 [Pirellulaceae bacterium]